jgi:hypothetical protein
MTKIVYNSCYGGFGLSDKAIQRYSDLAGLGLIHTNVSDRGWGYWELPDGEYWNGTDLLRTDPILIQVVEELGREADANFAKLAIDELPAGTLYHIHEYDGLETIMTQDDYDWSVA